MVGHLQPPSGLVDLSSVGNRLQDCREHKSDFQQIHPRSSRDIPNAENRHEGKEVGHNTERGEAAAELKPEKPYPFLQLRQGALRHRDWRVRVYEFVAFLWRGPHKFSKATKTLFAETASILRAIERKEKAFGGACVGPVHGWIGRRGQWHVGIRQQSQNDHQGQIGNESPLNSKSPNHQQHNQPKYHAVKETEPRFENRKFTR